MRREASGLPEWVGERGAEAGGKLLIDHISKKVGRAPFPPT